MIDVLKIFVILFATTTLQGYNLPQNTCEPYLNFRRVGYYGYEGVLKIPNDYSGKYYLMVNASLPFQTNQRMSIEVGNYNEIIARPVTELIYKLHFNSDQTFPKITEVVFNGNVLCSAPRYPLLPGGGVTNMWSNSIVESSIQSEGINGINYFEQTTKRTNFYPNYYNTKATSTTTMNSVDIRQGVGYECGFGGKKSKNTEVTDGEFPWLVAIFYYDEQNNYYKFHCTSTLISSRHVITAGHCLQFESILLHEKEDIILILGQTSLLNWSMAKTRGVVSKIDVHPKYTEGKSGHDMAILTMEKPVVFSSLVSPICLWNSGLNFGSFQGMEGIVAGWVQTTLKEAILAKSVSMRVASQEDCLKKNSEYNNVMSKDTFCGQGVNDDLDYCNGNSGAGFYVKINNLYYLRGLFAYTKNDGNNCNSNNYVVFADFLPDLNWINNIINHR